MNAGKSIKMALAKKGVTQVWLAEKLDIHKNRVGRICASPRVNTGTLDKIAKVLDMRVSEILALGED